MTITEKRQQTAVCMSGSGRRSSRWLMCNNGQMINPRIKADSLAEIATVLGHKTLAMVKRYAHLNEQHTVAVVARMNGRIFG